jgi:uncharacterized membrane protein HdeD (DUF308 family)
VWFVVAGSLSIIFGTLLATRPDVGAISLALIFGIYSPAFGVAQIVLGVQARRAAGTAAGRLAAT